MTQQVIDAPPGANSNVDAGRVTVRTEPSEDVNVRARNLMAKIREASMAATGQDDGAEPDADVAPADPIEVPDESPAAKPVKKLAAPTVDELAAKAKAERERLKLRRTETNERTQFEAERAQFQQQVAAFQKAREQHDGKIKALESGDPAALRELLERLGGDAVADFMLAEADPSRRAAREAQRAQKPETKSALEERFEQLEARINEDYTARQRAANEASFQARVAQVNFAADEGGAPLAAALMAKNPARAMKMAYEAMNELARPDPRTGIVIPFDDDAIIAKMEEELSGFAPLFANGTQAPPPKAPNGKGKLAETVAPDPEEDDDPPEAPGKPPARRVANDTRLTAKQEYMQRVASVRRSAQAYQNRK